MSEQSEKRTSQKSLAEEIEEYRMIDALLLAQNYERENNGR
jgi:hypothetical protein